MIVLQVVLLNNELLEKYKKLDKGADALLLHKLELTPTDTVSDVCEDIRAMVILRGEYSEK